MTADFEGKVVIITGSSAGIGQAAAALFAKHGASVTIHGRNEEKLQETIKLIEKEGGSKDKVLTVVGEIIDETVKKNLINKTVEKFGKIDILINNAGIKKKESLEDHRSLENFDYVFNVNLRAPVAITELAIPHLEKTKGNIINVSSITALRTQPISPFYGMTKAALDHFCRNYASILAPKGIRVNNLSPGATDTDFNPRHGIIKEIWAKIQQASNLIIPLGRWASANEMADFLLFMASDKASYMTGQMIIVDGGSTIAAMGPNKMVADFKGKVVIVTGSSAGIGQAAAILFARHGASVTIHGRNEEKLRETIALMEKEGSSKDKILTVVGEITDKTVQKNLIDKTVEKFGRIDVLINNAGIQKKPGEEQRSMANLDYILDVNLKAPIALMELSIPHLEKTKGNIINVSSIGAKKTVPPFPFYTISKAGLDHTCRNYAAILAPKGIRVNNLSPGATDTDFVTRHGFSEQQYNALRDSYSKTIPLGRFASSEEMAKYLIHIASDDFRYMTGQIVSVDGGSLIAPGTGLNDLK